MIFIYGFFLFLVTQCLVVAVLICLRKIWGEWERRSKIMIQSSCFQRPSDGLPCRSGVREIRLLEVFVLLFQGVMVVHMLILFGWYPHTKQVPPFLGANSQQSWTNLSTNFWMPWCSRINQQRQSTTSTKFWTKLF